MGPLLNRVTFSAAIIAVSVLVHLGFVGAIVFAERRHLPPSELRAMDVDLVPPEQLEPKKEEPPKPPEPPKQAELLARGRGNATLPEGARRDRGLLRALLSQRRPPERVRRI